MGQGEEEQEQAIERTPQHEEKQQNKEKGFKIASGILLAFGIIFILFFAKKMPTGLIITTLIAVFVISLLLAYFMKIKEWWGKQSEEEEQKKSSKLPKPLSQEELRQIVKKEALCNAIYFNEVKSINDINHKNIPTKEGGDNIIYNFQVTTLSPQKLGGDYGWQKCNIIYNANFPDMGPTVLFGATNHAVEQAIKSKAVNAVKEEPPEVEEYRGFNPMTGGFEQSRKVGRPKKSENTQSKEKDKKEKVE